MPGTGFVTTVEGIAVGNATIASQGRDDYCKHALKGFDNTAASVDEKREYARCVQFLYPTKQDRHELGQVLGLSLLAFVAYAGWVEWGMEKIESGHWRFAWQAAPYVVLAVSLMLSL